MVGRFGGAILAVALLGGIFVVSSPSEAAQGVGSGTCGPVTLDMLFPGLDPNGNPTTTTTVPPTTPPSTTSPSSSTTVPSDTSTTAQGETTTTTSPTTTTTTIVSTTTTAPASPTNPCRTWAYDMVFPIAIDARVISDFGDPRDGGARKHKGTDLVADRMSPVVAVSDGVVSSIHNTPAEDCCYLTIRHDDGWSSLYVHLNNDNYPGDDGLGVGVAPGLEVGDQVAAGQVIGWVGDSGNAEGTIPHLHFELRNSDGYSVDPVPSIRKAKAGAELSTQQGVYADDDDLPIQIYATHLAAAGGYWPCDDNPFELCPNRLAQPAEVAQLIGQLMGTSPVLVDTVQRTLAIEQFVPPRRLAEVTGCESIETCLQSGITGADVARMISWVYDAESRLAVKPDTDQVADIPLPSATSAETKLRFRGIIDSCHDPVDSDQLVTRADVVDLVTWWILGENPVVCGQRFDPDV